MTRDPSERRESDRIKSLVDIVVDGIVTIDKNGIIESPNPAAERSVRGWPTPTRPTDRPGSALAAGSMTCSAGGRAAGSLNGAGRRRIPVPGLADSRPAARRILIVDDTVDAPESLGLLLWLNGPWGVY